MTAILLANGARSTYVYDNADRVLQLNNSSQSGTQVFFWTFTYTYDAVGNRIASTDSMAGTLSWTYDKAYQLTNENLTGGGNPQPNYSSTYTYDGVGNRTLMVSTGTSSAGTSTYSYDAANQLTVRQSPVFGIPQVISYSYDGAGNVLGTVASGNQLTTNIWDGESRLTGVVLPSLVRNTFAYNGDGQRVQKQDSTGTTNHVWDGQNILLDLGPSTIVYTLEPALYGSLISQARMAEWTRTTSSTRRARRGC